MAAPAKTAPAKSAPKKAKGDSISRLYEVKGNSLSRKNKTCPKCGPGYFLGVHKNRDSCGKCGYTEMKK